MSNKKAAPRPSETPSDLSRRQFLVRSAGVAGVSMGMGVRPQVVDGEAETADRLRVAVVGAGQRGMKLLSVLHDQPNVETAAVVEPHPRRRGNARRLAGETARSFSDLRALRRFAQTGSRLDAVFIASPPAFHREQAVVALELGLHVYLEKPMALTVTDCDAVLGAAIAAEARGLVFQMGFQRRYSPRYRASVASIHRGEAGSMPFIRAQWHAQGSNSGLKTWAHDREQSGGILVEQASHQFDIFNWIFGAPPLRACGFGGRDQGAPDHCGLLLEYPTGGRVLLSHVASAVPDRRFAGVHELVFGDDVGIELGSGRAWDRQGQVLDLVDPAVEIASRDDTRLALQGFLGHVRDSGSPLADARHGHRATLTALFCRTALDQGQVLTWDDFRRA